jgi:hypothetical protein
MLRFFATSLVTGALLALSGCGGVPLSALPKLVQMQNELLDINPTEFRVALQVDARLSPPSGVVPMLVVKLAPAEPGAFETIDKKLPLQVAVTSSALQGLKAPQPGRRWLIYSMPAPTQAEFTRAQNILRQAKTLPNNKGRGSLAMGVEQDSLAVTDPALATTRWDTWIQTRQADGFFEVWSGTAAQIRALAADKK